MFTRWMWSSGYFCKCEGRGFFGWFQKNGTWSKHMEISQCSTTPHFYVVYILRLSPWFLDRAWGIWMQLQRHWVRMDGQEGGQWSFVEDATQRYINVHHHVTWRNVSSNLVIVLFFWKILPKLTFAIRLRDLHHMVKKRFVGNLWHMVKLGDWWNMIFWKEQLENDGMLLDDWLSVETSQ